MALTPVKHDGDRDTPLTIKCAWCGKIICFTKSEVYVNGPSYVCRDHAAVLNLKSEDHNNDDLNLPHTY